MAVTTPTTMPSNMTPNSPSKKIPLAIPIGLGVVFLAGCVYVFRPRSDLPK